MVADLYDKEDGVIAKKTKDTNDYGVDIVVLFEDGKHGLLVQCKHKEKPYESHRKRSASEQRAPFSMIRKQNKAK